MCAQLLTISALTLLFINCVNAQSQPPPQRITASQGHTCLLRRDGEVWCWGSNLASQSGQTATEAILRPRKVTGLPSRITKIFAARGANSGELSTTCALDNDSDVWCWGFAIEQGRFISALPRRDPLYPKATLLAPETHKSCVIGVDLRGYCNDIETQFQTIPGLIDPLLDFSWTYSAYCAVTTGGDVKCWGPNYNYSAGVDVVGADGFPAPVTIPTTVVSGAANIARYGDFSCATLLQGGLKCWGTRSYAGFGDGGIRKKTPEELPFFRGKQLRKVVLGAAHSCALDTTGRVYCWGDNSRGQLATDTVQNSNEPLEVGPRRFADITAGADYVCAIGMDENVQCWGGNVWRQLGFDPAGFSNRPQKVLSGSSVDLVATGDLSTCAITGGLRKCWGEGVGTSPVTIQSAVFPVDLRQMIGLSHIIPGRLGRYCGIRMQGGEVICDDVGVIEGSGAGNLLISGGHGYTACFITSASGLKCFGCNFVGILGNGAPLNYSCSINEPTINLASPVVGMDGGVTDVAVGRTYACAIKNGRVYCWGQNGIGQLGDGTKIDRASPVEVVGLPGTSRRIVVQDYAFPYESCAQLSDGRVYCWGGSGGTVTGNPPPPHEQPELRGAVNIVATGGVHCGIFDSGVIRCIGDNRRGQIGDGSNVSRSQAAIVVDIPPVRNLVGNGRHYCAIDGSSSLWCWGSNTLGQLGIGVNSYVATPGVVLGVPSDEPFVGGVSLPNPDPPNASCPAGFFIASAEDGPGVGLRPGVFGMEVLLDQPGTRLLAGGLNFGGLIDAGQPGFAGFNFANPANESQRLSLRVTGSPSSSSSGSLPVRILIERRPDANTSVTVFEATTSLTLASAYTNSIELPTGFYAATVSATGGSAGGEADGQFFFELTTSFVNRPGGGFQGGAVVGGYHAAHPFGGVSGFAAFCLATPHSASIRVLSRPTYGATGAEDLRLKLRDAQQRELIVVPAS